MRPDSGTACFQEANLDFVTPQSLKQELPTGHHRHTVFNSHNPTIPHLHQSRGLGIKRLQFNQGQIPEVEGEIREHLLGVMPLT